MKKSLLSFFLILCALCSACAAPEVPASDGAYTFTDDLGRQVCVHNPRRVAALLGSFAQIWYLAGGQVVATADDAWEELNLPMPDGAVNLGATQSLSLELLLSARPDLVLASTNTRQNIEWREALEGAGIPVAYFDISDFDDYLRLLDISTDITGRKDLYARYGTDVQTQIHQVISHSKARLQTGSAPTVLSLTASASFVKAKHSEGNVLGAMLKQLGCINIADSEEMLLQDLSIEHILMCDPDYIFIVQRGDNESGMRAYVQEFFMSHPAWSRLTAVRNGRVYFMEKELYSLKPNHRWGEAYEKLEDIFSHE